MSPAGDISADEALENSKELNSRESSGQLRHCTCIFYHVFHRIVDRCTRHTEIDMAVFEVPL